MRFKVVGEAKYEYEVEAKDDEEAVEKAIQIWYDDISMTGDWCNVLEWEAKEVFPKGNNG